MQPTALQAQAAPSQLNTCAKIGMLLLFLTAGSALAETIEISAAEALRYEQLQKWGNSHSQRAGARLTTTTKDTAYCAVKLTGKLTFAKGDPNFFTKPEQIKLTDADGNAYPMVGQLFKGGFSNQPQGLVRYNNDAKNPEHSIDYTPVFAVPKTLTEATIDLAGKAKSKVTIKPATAINVPEHHCTTTVKAVEITTARIYDSYPGFQEKPANSVDWHPAAGEWLQLTIEFKPQKSNHWSNKNVFSINPKQYGILQEVNGKKVYTPCAGLDWNSGLTDNPKSAYLGKTAETSLFFAVPALASKAQLLFEGNPITDFKLPE